MYYVSRFTFLLLSLLALTACVPKTSGDKPPAIAYGQDVCDLCGMVIDEPRFAAAYVTADGQTRRFDDIGDMFIYAEKHGEETAVFWVHDYTTEEWVRADQAFFVRSTKLATPMGSGLTAHVDKARAEAMVLTWEGEIMTLAALQELAQIGQINPDMMGKHGHPHGPHE